LPLYLMTVPSLRVGTVCKNRDKPIKYTVRVIGCVLDLLSYHIQIFENLVLHIYW
jgi:hypothetical protein